MNLLQDTKNSESLQTIVTFDSIKRWKKMQHLLNLFIFFVIQKAFFAIRFITNLFLYEMRVMSSTIHFQYIIL